MDIKTFVQHEAALSRNVVDEFFNTKRKQSQVLGVDFLEMLEHLHVYSLAKGKWGRPTLARLAYEVVGGDQTERDALLKGSAAFEIFHRFLLIHDDIFDRDFTRHDAPTIEKIYLDAYPKKYTQTPPELYASSMAMIGGDLMFAYAFELIRDSGFDAETVANAIKALSTCLAETTAGWLTETHLKNIPISEVTETSIMQALTHVSAHYSVLWPLRLGQIYAGKNDNFDTALETYGIHVGIAFQIHDDIMAFTGNPDTMGKRVGNDLEESKKSLVLLNAYESASNNDKQVLQNSLGKPCTPEELLTVQGILSKTGALEKTEALAKKHAQKGIQALTSTHIPSLAIEKLVAIAEFMVNRDH